MSFFLKGIHMMNFWNGDIAFVVHKKKKSGFKKKIIIMSKFKIKCIEIFSMQESSI
jgi:hypothetical protein